MTRNLELLLKYGETNRSALEGLMDARKISTAEFGQIEYLKGKINGKADLLLLKAHGSKDRSALESLMDRKEISVAQFSQLLYLKGKIG